MPQENSGPARVREMEQPGIGLVWCGRSGLGILHSSHFGYIGVFHLPRRAVVTGPGASSVPEEMSFCENSDKGFCRRLRLSGDSVEVS